MTKAELERRLSEGGRYQEIWIRGPSGQSICALINGDRGWLMYQRWDGDAGYSSRNPSESSEEDVEFYLSNGQCDVYPRSWTYPLGVLKEALFDFMDDGRLPERMDWHDDSE